MVHNAAFVKYIIAKISRIGLRRPPTSLKLEKARAGCFPDPAGGRVGPWVARYN